MRLPGSISRFEDKEAREEEILIIVENLPVPFDSRVWKEACALHDAG